MTFGESINRCLKEKYSDFNGRASRSEYWWFALFQFMVYLVVILATGGIIDYETGGVNGTGAIIFLIVFLALIVPAIAAAVRRLHDTDKKRLVVSDNICAVYRRNCIACSACIAGNGRCK